MLGADGGAGLRREERGQGRHAQLPSSLADVHRRLDPDATDSAGHYVLQQVTIITRYLDHERFSAKAEPADSPVNKALRVRHPGGREGREVRIFGKGFLGCDQRRQLREHAVLAEPHVQRIGWLRLVKLCGREEPLAWRRGAKVQERAHPSRSAQSAAERLTLIPRNGVRRLRDTVHERCHLFLPSGSPGCQPQSLSTSAVRRQPLPRKQHIPSLVRTVTSQHRTYRLQTIIRSIAKDQFST